LLDRLCLQHPDLKIVECRVVVNVRRVADQPVVGDHDDAVGLGLFQHIRQRGAVDCGNDQRLHALGHHVLDLRELVWNVVLGILQVGTVAALLQYLDDVVAVVDPPRGSLGRHRYSDRRLGLRKSGAA